MRELVASFPRQLQEALEIGKSANLKPAERSITNLVIIGLGGSGIGGTVVGEILFDQSPVPIQPIKDYQVPNYINENTLVIVSSYSGNTEESLMAMKAAEAKGAMIACITSGGSLLDHAKSKGYNFIQVPGGNPPRSMFAYSFTQLLFLTKHYGLHQLDVVSELSNSVTLLESESIEKEALDIAKALEGKSPVIYACAGYEGVAVRLRQQINENAKLLCWHHVIPEMNHNELVGWKDQREDIQAVLLRNTDDFERNQTRVEINKGIIEPKSNPSLEIWSKGESKVQRVLYHVHFGDWVSVHLGEMRNVDLVEVKVIDYLKGELAKK